MLAGLKHLLCAYRGFQVHHVVLQVCDVVDVERPVPAVAAEVPRLGRPEELLVYHGLVEKLPEQGQALDVEPVCLELVVKQAELEERVLGQLVLERGERRSCFPGQFTLSWCKKRAAACMHPDPICRERLVAVRATVQACVVLLQIRTFCSSASPLLCLCFCAASRCMTNLPFVRILCVLLPFLPSAKVGSPLAATVGLCSENPLCIPSVRWEL